MRPDTDEIGMAYHLMHPGDESSPGDPNAAFYLDGIYHLHYILRHPWKDGRSFSFVHVTSPDMLHWTWQPTKLQPAFTGHGMFSGTGFVTKEGKPAIVYHGQGSGRNHIAIAKDTGLSAWERPYPVEVRTASGDEPDMRHWDPDCFLIGDTYYAISGGKNPPLMKSTDLRRWTYVGAFLQREMPDVLEGEDISCPNFFRLGTKWMLLCISHPLGCRYYVGDWDHDAEQFVPHAHGRMNWRREEQEFGELAWRDCFAPESVLAADGRRVMWAWLCTVPGIGAKTVQSLPREISLSEDGAVRVSPIVELASLRHSPFVVANLPVTVDDANHGGMARKRVKSACGHAAEIRVTVSRDQAERKLLGITLFADCPDGGMSVVVRPDTKTLRVGTTEAPFAVADLPAGEDLELRIFVDACLVEVFANNRQALAAVYTGWDASDAVDVFAYGASTTFRRVEIWKLNPTHEGYRDARQSRNWQPLTE